MDERLADDAGWHSLRAAQPGRRPLPAAEVRRLGDRRRRRRTAAIGAVGTVGTVGLVAAVVFGSSFLTTAGLPDSDDRQEYAATPAFRTDIPENLALTTGWSESEPYEQDSEFSGIPWCDDLGDSPAYTDVASVAVEEETGGGAYRTLTTYATTADAEQRLEGLRGATEDCGTFGAPLDDPDLAALGDETVAVPLGDGTRLLVVVRVSNVLLASSRSSDSGIDVTRAAEETTPLIGLLETTFGPEPGEDPSDNDTALSPEGLLRVVDLPDRSGTLDDWANEDPLTEEYTLACQPGLLRELLPIETDAYAEFTARYPLAEGTTADPSTAEIRDAAINTGLLRFENENIAAQAYDTVSEWLAECTSIGGYDVTVSDAEESVAGLPDGATGQWWGYSYLSDEACGGGGCDSVRNHAMGIALVGTDLVLVSYAEGDLGEGNAPREEIAALIARAANRAS